MGIGLFSHVTSVSKRENGFKLCQKIFELNISKYFFTERVIQPWHSLPRVGDSPPLARFKSSVDVGYGLMVALAVLGRQLDPTTLEVFSKLKYFIILF